LPGDGRADIKEPPAGNLKNASYDELKRLMMAKKKVEAQARVDRNRSPSEILKLRALQGFGRDDVERVDSDEEHPAKVEKTRDKRKQSKSSKRSASSGSDSSSHSDLEKVFRAATVGDGSKNKVQKLATKAPGKLLLMGLRAMVSFCDPQAMASSGSQKPLNMVAVKYVLTCLQASKKVKMEPELEREVRTLAESIDLLVSGNLAGLGELLMQRFKALELRINHGDTALSKHIELLPESEYSTMTLMEKEMAAEMERRHLKLAKLQRGHSARKE